jgi:hypothetical protein
MKLVILVDDLKYTPGIYGYNPLDVENIEEPIKDNFNTVLSVLSSAVGVSAGTSTALSVGTRVLGSLTPWGAGISGALIAGAIAKGSYEVLKKNQDAMQGVWGLQQSIENDTPEILQYLNSSVIVHYSSIAKNYKDAHKKNEFYGAFVSPKQMQKILEADGTNSEIIITSVDTAQHSFDHIGKGFFSPGKYIFHPKKLNVLVPFDSYHSILLNEHDEEFVQFFASLGAKTISINTIEGVTIDGTAVIPARGKGKVKYTNDETADKIYEFFPQTINIDTILDNKVWIQDFPKMLTFLETRKSHRLKKFTESVNINTSFGVDVDVMLQFDSKFTWNKNSSYRYEIEFYSEKELSELY